MFSLLVRHNVLSPIVNREKRLCLINSKNNFSSWIGISCRVLSSSTWNHAVVCSGSKGGTPWLYLVVGWCSCYFPIRFLRCLWHLDSPCLSALKLWMLEWTGEYIQEKKCTEKEVRHWSNSYIPNNIYMHMWLVGWVVVTAINAKILLPPF